MRTMVKGPVAGLPSSPYASLYSVSHTLGACAVQSVRKEPGESMISASIHGDRIEVMSGSDPGTTGQGSTV